MRLAALLLVVALGCGKKESVLTTSGSNAGSAAANDPWAGRSDLITAPAPKPPATIELPAFETYKLANGLAVFVIKSDRLPVASMQLAITAGRMHEPRARLGVAEFTADMLVKGTRKRSAVALAKAIDFVGGTIAADATYEATLMSCSVLDGSSHTCDSCPGRSSEGSFGSPS